jgi:hypothetical protein
VSVFLPPATCYSIRGGSDHVGDFSRKKQAVRKPNLPPPTRPYICNQKMRRNLRNSFIGQGLCVAVGLPCSREREGRSKHEGRTVFSHFNPCSLYCIFCLFHEAMDGHGNTFHARARGVEKKRGSRAVEVMEGMACNCALGSVLERAERARQNDMGHFCRRGRAS